MTQCEAAVGEKSGTRFSSAPRALLAAAALTELTCGVLQGFLGPILRQLTVVLHVSSADLSWVSIADLLAGTALIPLLARLGDLYGRRRVLRWTMSLVLVGSVTVGLSRSLPVLLAGSMMQASMTACFPLLAGIIRDGSGRPGDRRGLSTLVTSLVAGLAVGTLASGVVAHVFAEPTAALWVPAVATAVALAVVWRVVPESTGPVDSAPRRLDWALAVVLSAGLALVMLAVSKSGSRGWGWSAPRTVSLLVAGLLLTTVWLVLAGRSRRPVIDPRTFLDRRSAVFCLISLAFAFCMIGPVVPDAIYLSASPRATGYGLGLAPLAESMALIPNLAAMALGTVAARRFSSLRGDRATLTLGSALMATGYLGALAGSRSRTELLGALALVGLGCGILQFATRTLAVEAAPAAAISAGSGVNEILITIGGSLGAAVALTLQSSHTAAGHLLPSFGAFTAVWTLCASVGIASAAVSLCYPSIIQPRRSGSMPAASPFSTPKEAARPDRMAEPLANTE